MNETTTLNVVRGVTLSPPVIGRITMGHTKVVVKGGDRKRLPVKDDHFNITTLVQNSDDLTWEKHPVEALVSKAAEKLTSIPVRIAYNDPNLNLKNSFSVFGRQNGRVLCCGNGDKARRMSDDGILDIDCPRPEACKYGQDNRCQSMSRAYFRIDDSGDELGVFILRTTSWNSLSRLGVRLSSLGGLTNGAIAGMPMQLVLRRKTSAASRGSVFYFADIIPRAGQTLLDAIKEGAEYQKAMSTAGLSLAGMEDALRAGLANSDFADEIEDPDEWLSDEELAAVASGSTSQTAIQAGLGNLADTLKKLAEKAKQGDSPAATPAPDESEGSTPTTEATTDVQAGKKEQRELAIV